MSQNDPCATKAWLTVQAESSQEKKKSEAESLKQKSDFGSGKFRLRNRIKVTDLNMTENRFNF